MGPNRRTRKKSSSSSSSSHSSPFVAASQPHQRKGRNGKKEEGGTKETYVSKFQLTPFETQVVEELLVTHLCHVIATNDEIAESVVHETGLFRGRLEEHPCELTNLKTDLVVTIFQRVILILALNFRRHLFVFRRRVIISPILLLAAFRAVYFYHMPADDVAFFGRATTDDDLRIFIQANKLITLEKKREWDTYLEIINGTVDVSVTIYRERIVPVLYNYYRYCAPGIELTHTLS